MNRRALLRDLGLLLLALAAVAAVAFVLFRPVTTETADVLPQAPSSAAPSPTPGVTPAPVQALFVGSELLLGSPSAAELTAQQLGWTATVDAVPGSGFVAGATLVERVPAVLGAQQADVVVLFASEAPAESADLRRLGGNAQFVVNAVRQALPEARVVVVGPVASMPEATAQRDVLLRVAARYGAVFVDPAGSGYLPAPTALLDDGSLTPDGAVQFADRLGADLLRVLPPTLLPSPRPTP